MPPSYPNRSSGGGRSFGGRGGGGFSLSFPPFRGAVRMLVLINVAVYFLVLFGNVASRGFQYTFDQIFGLTPVAVMHGWLWQLITYGFLHVGLSHILVNMLMLWMFGSTLEASWGRTRFLNLYFFALIGSALTTMAVGYFGWAIVRGGSVTPFFYSLEALRRVPTVGASGAVYGVLVAFGILFADQELFLFPIPFRIKAKYMIVITVVVVLASALQPGTNGVANFAHLGGLFFGWLYVRIMPQRTFAFSFSEQYYGIRNSYYRWKRRRAARKFEVYMRQQGETKLDRSHYFDEYGNYRDPKSRSNPPGKDNGERRGPWVN